MSKAIEYAQQLDDDFFRDAAYKKIVVLLAFGGELEQAETILSGVQIDFIKENIIKLVHLQATEYAISTKV